MSNNEPVKSGYGPPPKYRNARSVEWVMLDKTDEKWISVQRFAQVNYQASGIKYREVSGRYAISMVISGEGEYHDAVAGGNCWTLRKGSVFTREYMKPHYIKSSATKPLRCWMVAALGKGTKAWFDRHQWGTKVHRVNNAGAIERVFQQMSGQAFSDQPWARSVCGHYLEILFYELLRGTHGELGKKADNAMTRYREARQWIEANYQQTRGTSEIAAGLGVSVSYLCRLFREYDDGTPLSYLEGLKMSAAASALGDHSRNLQSIAEGLGYPDAYSFGKRFKKWYGLPPGKYRAMGGD